MPALCLGEKVSVCSTGIGGPSGGRLLWRSLPSRGSHILLCAMGTCGGIDTLVSCGGDCVIATGAVRIGGNQPGVCAQ